MDKKYDLRSEGSIQQYWADNKVYKYDPNHDGVVYSIDTPPPTVSGKIHIGHIFSYTQAEMIARYQRMQGRNVFYPFGFDDNGLPTERLVEKDLSILAKDMPREAFVQACLQSTKLYEDEFKDLWQQMGFSCDWSLAYRTIDETSQRISQRSFLKLLEAGKAYLDESPVLWCSHCHTSIAQAELESQLKSTDFNRIVFKASEKAIEIATTRPEMLYACVAIFVHPDDSRYKALIGQNARVPIYGHEVKIMADDKVDPEKGTGIVMCCTFGDTVDLEWYKSYDLPYRKVIDETGHIDQVVPLIGGMYLKKARKVILEHLKASGHLLDQSRMDHHVSVHERCGTEIEILPSKQWYIDILSHKDLYMKMADDINWYPSHMKKRFMTWVENLKWDWCVSRQRYYGVPIPVWYCESCGKTLLPDMDSLPVNPMTVRPDICDCGSSDYRPETAVLDTWATSSVTPQINRLWEEEGERDGLTPMSLRTQAHEIIRTWAFYTIVKHYEHHGSIPWQDIMISGFVLAKKGEKISKSKNNASSSPLQLINQYSADAIRYWTANSRLGTDMMFDEAELKLSKRMMTKLWNAMKFAIMQLEDFKGYEPEKIQEEDAWIVAKYYQTVNKAKAYLDRYEVGLARNTIDDFFWKDFCDDYLEYVKDRLYKTDQYTKASVESGRNAMYLVSLGILKLYAIYMPHMTETIYLSYYKKFENELSLHLLKWDETRQVDEDQLIFAETISSILACIRKYKTERQMSIKEPLKHMTVTSPLANLAASKKDLKACLHLERISLKQGAILNISIE